MSNGRESMSLLADKHAFAQDALAFGLLAVAFSALAERMFIIDPPGAVVVLRELAAGIDAGVQTIPPEVRGDFNPEAVAAARARVIDVLQEAMSKTAHRGVA